jgi:TetR/AcrR family transcriptional regulator, transcriptional repressor for nem operon
MLDATTLDKTVPTVKPPTKGERTRTRILDEAYGRIVEKGFAATSIEELVEAAGITKGGFFYHFKDKNDLARQLLERYLEESQTLLDHLEARARELSEDPLHSFLIFLKLYGEALEDVMSAHPGCLVSAITYQDRSFDPDVRRLNSEGVLGWRARFERWLREIVVVHPPRTPVDLTDLADQMSVVADGAIITSKALKDPRLIGRQMAVHRDLVRMLFAA